MLEQPETEERPGFAIVSLKLALSQEARASLEMVRVAQESAQRRARQQTMQARIWVALLMGAVVLGAIALGPRVRRWRQARSHAAQAAQTPARTSPIAPEPAAPAPTVPSAAEPVVVQAKAQAQANDNGLPAEGCDTSTRRG